MNVLLAALVVAPLQDPLLLDLAWEHTGAQPGERFGTALAAGDVDGNGFEDLFVGSPGPGGIGSYGGRVELYRGGTAGLEATPSWTRAGGWPGARFGAALATADVNGDGFDDLVVAAPDFDVPAERRRARAGLGQNPGSGGTPPAASRDEGAVSLFLGNALGQPTLRRVILGLDSGEHLGSAVANAGDVNGDGYEDVLVGASGKDGNRGLVLLFHGSPSGLPSLPAWWLPGTLADTGFGTLLAGAGDQDGDGYGDFALGHAPMPTGFVEGQGFELYAESTHTDAVASNSGERLDIDGDGLEDALVRTSGLADNGSSLQRGLRLYLGSPAGLRPRAIWGDEATTPLLGDTDGDGRLEIGYLGYTAGGMRFRELR